MKNVFCTLLIFAVVLSSCTKSDNTKNTRTINGSGHLKSLPDSGLIALYEFTGNADDGSGNGNNGTIHGGVTLCNDRFGNPNMAYHFNGIDSYITTVTGGPLGTSPRTVCFWVKSSSFNMQYLVSYGDTALQGRCFGTGLNNPCPGIGFDNGFGVAMRGNDSLLDGKWHQLVIVWEGPPNDINVSDGTFYIDGEVSNVINCLALYNSPVNTLAGCPYTIGADLDGGRILDGCIDDIRIYNRALTANEILLLFMAPNPRQKNGVLSDTARI